MTDWTGNCLNITCKLQSCLDSIQRAHTVKKKKKDSVEYNKDSEKDRAGKAAKKYLLSGIDRERFLSLVTKSEL